MFSFASKTLFRPFYLCISLMLPSTAMAADSGAKIGVVVMHGKGGSPTRFVSDLAAALKEQGYLVANLEMPWSGKRNYDVDVSAAENEVEAALSSLRNQGAIKLFVAGHSQGGLFTFHFGNKYIVDGLIAIAPGGNTASKLFSDNLGAFVSKARALIAEGKGNEKTSLGDFESAKGSNSFMATPTVYLTWFDPQGAMNEWNAISNVLPATPVLYIAPKHDYPGLMKIKNEMYSGLPKNKYTQLYEPDCDHLKAPAVSANEIIAWTKIVSQSNEK